MTRTHSASAAGATAREAGGSSPRHFLPRRARLSLLTAHIMISVGLLGDSAGFAAVSLRLAGTADPVARLTLVETLRVFGTWFGIPLSVGAILTGIALGLGTKWGVLRYPWVVTKLLLIVSVMAVGGLVIGPALDALRAGGPDLSARLVAAGSYDVLALGLATGLSVFKPGRAWRSAA